MDSGHTLIAGLAIVLGLGAPITLIALIRWYKSRKTRLIHETALRLAEKGQSVPPELFMGLGYLVVWKMEGKGCNSAT